MLERLNQILSAPTAIEREEIERKQKEKEKYECGECGTNEPKTVCRTRQCLCCPKCGTN